MLGKNIIAKVSFAVFGVLSLLPLPAVAQEAARSDRELWNKLIPLVSQKSTVMYAGNKHPSAVFIENVPMVKQVEGVSSISASIASAIRVLDKHANVETGINPNDTLLQEMLADIESVADRESEFDKFIKRTAALSKASSEQLHVGKYLTLGVNLSRVIEQYRKKTAGDAFSALNTYALDRGYEANATLANKATADLIIKSLEAKNTVVLFDSHNAYLAIGYMLDKSSLFLCVVDPGSVDFLEMPRKELFGDEKLKLAMANIDKKFGLKKIDINSSLEPIPQNGIKFVQYEPGKYDVILLKGFIVTRKSISSFLAGNATH